MKPNRRLSLRREVVGTLDADQLRAVAGAHQPRTLRECTNVCAPSQQPWLHCAPTVDINTCRTLFC